MYKDHTVSVVVPAYNEEESVGEVIRTLPAIVDRAYVVDDGSTDDTWGAIRRHAAAVNEGHDGAFDRLVVPIQHDRNRGVGGAIKTGYRRSLEDGVDVAAVLAGDDQMDPGLLERYLDPIVDGEADYTKGNRFGHEDIEEMPRFRYVGNVTLSLLTKIASGYWHVGDSQNGYTAISRRALEAIDLEGMYEYYGYCNDLLVRLNVAGMRVVEVPQPASYVYDEDWSSHIAYTEYVPRVSAMLFRDFLWRLRRTGLTPCVPLYGAGMLLGVLGVAGLLLAAGSSGLGPGWIGGLLFGGALFSFGAVADMRRDAPTERGWTDDGEST